MPNKVMQMEESTAQYDGEKFVKLLRIFEEVSRLMQSFRGNAGSITLYLNKERGISNARCSDPWTIRINNERALQDFFDRVIPLLQAYKGAREEYLGLSGINQGKFFGESKGSTEGFLSLGEEANNEMQTALQNIISDMENNSWAQPPIPELLSYLGISSIYSDEENYLVPPLRL